MTTLRPDPRVGSELGPYRIESVIGRGGMGVVYLAEQPSLGRKVALKVIAPEFSQDPRAKARFLRESQMAAAIDHPNILPIHEAGELDGVLFIAMRYVDGEDLAKRLAREPLTPQASVAILAQIAAALDAAHAQGLIHRDVKPANILLDPHAGPDGADHAYLTDFGLTKRGGSEGSLTAVGGFAGTLAYIAPEQVEGGEVDGRTDEYSLACVAYECLAGRPPLERETDIALAMAHLRDPVPSVAALNPALPAAVDPVLARGLAKNPTERYASCSAFAEGLRFASIQTDLPARAPGVRVRIAVVVTSVVIVAAVGVAAAALAFSLSTPAASPTLDDSGSDVFPNALERELVAQVGTYRVQTASGGHELSSLCGRGSFELLPTESAGHPVAPLATLECSLEGAGADHLAIRWLRPSDRYTAGSVLSKLADELDIESGDCARGAVAKAGWSLAEREIGSILCFHDDATGDAVIVWTIDESQLLLEARRMNGNAVTLYDWWSASGRYIGR